MFYASSRTRPWCVPNPSGFDTHLTACEAHGAHVLDDLLQGYAAGGATTARAAARPLRERARLEAKTVCIESCENRLRKVLSAKASERFKVPVRKGRDVKGIAAFYSSTVSCLEKHETHQPPDTTITLKPMADPEPIR